MKLRPGGERCMRTKSENGRYVVDSERGPSLAREASQWKWRDKVESPFGRKPKGKYDSVDI